MAAQSNKPCKGSETMDLPMTGKKAIVTGASEGIGKAIAGLWRAKAWMSRFAHGARSRSKRSRPKSPGQPTARSFPSPPT